MWIEKLAPPDVVVHCAQEDGNIELFKASRVRNFEANDPQVMEYRGRSALYIRERCHKDHKERQNRIAREAYLGARLASRCKLMSCHRFKPAANHQDRAAEKANPEEGPRPSSSL